MLWQYSSNINASRTDWLGVGGKGLVNSLLPPCTLGFTWVSATEYDMILETLLLKLVLATTVWACKVSRLPHCMSAFSSFWRSSYISVTPYIFLHRSISSSNHFFLSTFKACLTRLHRASYPFPEPFCYSTSVRNTSNCFPLWQFGLFYNLRRMVTITQVMIVA